MLLSEAGGKMIHEKKWSPKFRGTVPLNGKKKCDISTRNVPMLISEFFSIQCAMPLPTLYRNKFNTCHLLPVSNRYSLCEEFLLINKLLAQVKISELCLLLYLWSRKSLPFLLHASCRQGYNRKFCPEVLATFCHVRGYNRTFCLEMEVTEIILAKVSRLFQLTSQSHYKKQFS